jgi:hypothetical protein
VTFVSTILHQIPRLSKRLRTFLLALFGALGRFAGRATMVNLSRYGAGSPRRIARWYSQALPWEHLNWGALEQCEVLEHRLAAVIDCSFLPKSGKGTYGLGFFHNGSSCRPERGLEVCLLGVVDLEENTAYSISAVQTPSHLEEGSRVDFYLEHILAETAAFEDQGIDYLLADGFFAKSKVFEALASTRLHLVTKLRCDADLRYLYQGPPKRGPGRPRRMDGKVDWEDFSRFSRLDASSLGLSVGSQAYSQVLYSPCFGQKLKVVVLLHQHKTRVTRQVLASSDTELEALQLVRMYQSRFQLEFVFRDAKQFCGLQHGQMRDEPKLHNHLNASLTALNLLRLEDRQLASIEPRRVISIDSWKRRNLNEHLLQRIFAISGIDPDIPKIQEKLHELRNIGVIAA